MKKSNVWILFLCTALLLCVSVLGTMAYLTSTDKAVNTFTVGKVSITLDEADVNLQGVPVKVVDGVEQEVDTVAQADRVKGNEYHLIPGQTYVKDPTVTVKAGSEESFVRMLVTINKRTELDTIFAPTGADLLSIFNGYNSSVWAYAGETKSGNTITYEFRYAGTGGTVDASESQTDIILPPLFESFTLPGTMDGDDLATLYTNENDRLRITVMGHAIQASGFADAESAWAAFTQQVSE